MPADDVLDNALDRLGRHGPEFGGGLSNHGPMVAEALVRLGRADAVPGWVDGYVARLDEPMRPSGRGPVLGEMSTYGDWEQRFAAELEHASWPDVLTEWLPRLAPGVMAAATHGWLRTAHAVRALRSRETPVRLAELGRGLAYWAARYQELPGPLVPAGHSQILPALAALPDRHAPGDGLIFESVRRLDRDDEFAAAVGAVDPSALDIDAMLSAAAQVIRSGDARAPIVYVHTLTPTAAARTVTELLEEHRRQQLLGATWRAVAALVSTYRLADIADRGEPPPVDADDVAERAIASGDEHAIKVSEAAFGPDASADLTVRAAAAALVARLAA